MIGNTAQRNLFSGAFIARSQSNIENARCDNGILHEHFVKISKTKEEDGIRVLGFNIQILAHHGGHFAHSCFRVPDTIGPKSGRIEKRLKITAMLTNHLI
jgi:hypothetical protein